MEIISLRDIIMRKRFDPDFFRIASTLPLSSTTPLLDLVGYGFQWAETPETGAFWDAVHSFVRRHGGEVIFKDEPWK